jgi:hypothetical protein
VPIACIVNYRARAKQAAEKPISSHSLLLKIPRKTKEIHSIEWQQPKPAAWF